MKPNLFTKKEKLLLFLRLYGLYNFLIDHHLIRKDLQGSVLFRRLTCQKLIKYYGGMGHKTDTKTGNLGFGLIHYAFVSVLRPKRVLCIGSRLGFIPAICALACKDNNFGHVDFVDAGLDKKDPKSWGGAGFWKKFDPKEHFKILNLQEWISTHVTTSREFAKRIRHTCQYIHIDGDHTYQGVKADYQLFWPRLEKNGIMSFHDISLKGNFQGEEYGVWKLWQKLKEGKISLNFGQESVGFLQKTA
jgi:hypothetical protein